MTPTSISVTDELQDSAGNDIVLSSGNTLALWAFADQQTEQLSRELATYTAYHLIDQNIVDAGGLTNSASAIGIDSKGVDVTDVSDDGDTGTEIQEMTQRSQT